MKELKKGCEKGNRIRHEDRQEDDHLIMKAAGKAVGVLLKGLAVVFTTKGIVNEEDLPEAQMMRPVR